AGSELVDAAVAGLVIHADTVEGGVQGFKLLGADRFVGSRSHGSLHITFSPISCRLFRPDVIVAFRTDEASLAESPVALDVDFQRRVTHHSLATASGRQPATGMADKNHQLVTVAFFEFNILPIGHLCVLETVYHHKIW